MDEIRIDDIFSDLVDENESLHVFADSFREKIPGVPFQIFKEGLTIPPEELLSPEVRASMRGAISQSKGFVRTRIDEKSCCYGVQVDEIGAMVVFRLTDISFDLTACTSGLALLQGLIDLVLVDLRRNELEVENTHYSRRVDVLKQQHQNLVEDNYRQYLINQEKEKGYAARLESEINRQTAELRVANTELIEANRLKSEFLANMSHEIRTPLNAITGFADLLLESGLKKEQEEYAKIVINAAAGLKVLINDILDLAKIEAGKQELDERPFNLPEMINNIAAMFILPAREKGVDFVAAVDPQLPAWVMGDPNQLRQVLLNLAGNGLKFTSDGKIEMRVERLGEEGERATIRFAVIDTGIGVPLERQQAIFEKFTQADGSMTRRYGGTGLGLTISKKIIELMGGEILLESAPGKGATFFFILEFPVLTAPATEEKSAPLASKAGGDAAVTLEAAAPKYTVLLVEDNPVNQKLAIILIKKQGYNVEVANNGLEALEKIRTVKADLVLMDIQMPKMGGVEATEKIRALEASAEKEQCLSLRGRTTPLPIAGLTAHVRLEDEKGCYQAGMNEFLTKPINKQKLFAVLNNWLA